MKIKYQKVCKMKRLKKKIKKKIKNNKTKINKTYFINFFFFS